MMINKEYGSDFSLTQDHSFISEKASNFFSTSNYSLFFSGRAALYNLLETGIINNNWQKFYVPSFYCHEVVDFLKGLKIEIIYYEFNPFLDESEKELICPDNDVTVVLDVLYFGLKRINTQHLTHCVIIDDLTHHLQGVHDSKADYCFGSLRKELPIPCGGFLYSPKQLKLPEGKYLYAAEEISIKKLAAMFLKKQYLLGENQDKDGFRKLFIESEHFFEKEVTNAKMPSTSYAVLHHLKVQDIIEKKNDNIREALDLLMENVDLRFNLDVKNNAVFGLIIECKNAVIQQKLKKHLIEFKVFPAVLWPNQILDRDKEVSERILFVHLDFRYNTEDIKIITTIINKFSLDE